MQPALSNASSTFHSNGTKPQTHRKRERIFDIQEQDRFHLEEKFIAAFEGLQPVWGGLAFVTYKRTYARPLPNGTSEEYWQTCQRVVEGVYTIQKHHCRANHLPWSENKAQRSAQEMFQLMWEFKFLPPGRGLWAMGTEYVERHGGAALNNCGFASTRDIDKDFTAPFTFLMDFSMLGVGIGGDMEGAGKVVIQRPIPSLETYVVEDSREGWVTLIERVLSCYVGEATLPSTVDYSLVRPEGAPIKGFGGTSSGPGPLMRAYSEIQRILNPLIGKPITSSAIADLFNIIGVCVVSGNVRRSAEILLGRPDDQEFADLKNPEINQQALLSHRWASNNSLFVTQGIDYSKAAESTARNGEPGYFWLQTARDYGRLADPPNFADKKAAGTNPCSEQTLEPFELCCLVETFPSKHNTYEEYQRTLKFAYLYAKTVTLVPTHNKRTNAVMMRNRRIGCSQSGIIQSFARHGRRTHFNWCDKGYKYLQHLDEIYANWLCIPRSKKMTSVKPSGTVSLLAGTTPGIHFEHAEYYYRTIRIAKTSDLIPPLREAGYRIEPDEYDASSFVVYFPIKAEFFDRAKTDVSMWEQLEIAAQMQHYWADNQVSITVTFKPNEAGDIKHALELYETRLKSVSFLPLEEHGYVQAPYITITKDEYEAAASVIKRLVLRKATHEVTERFCDGDKCVIA